MTKILVVDDNAFMRKMLIRLIETDPNLKVMGEADSSEKAKTLVRENSYDVILIDISLENEDSGIQLIREIRKGGNHSPILCVSLHEEPLYSNRIREAGGQGYLMKQDAGENIFAAVQSLAAGKSYWASEEIQTKPNS